MWFDNSTAQTWLLLLDQTNDGQIKDTGSHLNIHKYTLPIFVSLKIQKCIAKNTWDSPALRQVPSFPHHSPRHHVSTTWMCMYVCPSKSCLSSDRYKLNWATRKGQNMSRKRLGRSANNPEIVITFNDAPTAQIFQSLTVMTQQRDDKVSVLQLHVYTVQVQRTADQTETVSEMISSKHVPQISKFNHKACKYEKFGHRRMHKQTSRWTINNKTLCKCRKTLVLIQRKLTAKNCRITTWPHQ